MELVLEIRYGPESKGRVMDKEKACKKVKMLVALMWARGLVNHSLVYLMDGMSETK